MLTLRYREIDYRLRGVQCLNGVWG
jgi:hypothetical protein